MRSVTRQPVLPVAGVQHVALPPSLKGLGQAAAAHCRPLQLEAGACGQPRSVCWQRRRQPARPRGPSRRSRRGPTPGKLCHAVQYRASMLFCVGTQAVRGAQGCCHVGSRCSGLCGCHSQLWQGTEVCMAAIRLQPPAQCSACVEPAGAVSMQRCTQEEQNPMHEQTCVVVLSGDRRSISALKPGT